MRVEKLGSGEPKCSVVGSIHGDEPCGAKAIKRFIQSDFDILEPVKLIIANEKALEQDERYLEKDVNRSFPGDLDSDYYEERLAAKILEEVENTTVLDIHSTKSYSEPFGVVDGHMGSKEISLARNLGLNNVVNFSGGSGTLISQVSGINVESGFQGSDEAAENAYEILLRFLSAHDVISKEYDASEPNLFKGYGKVEGGWRFTADNFTKVDEGEKYAEDRNKSLEADEEFYPVLMSTNGYEDILGFKAKKVSKRKLLS